MKLYCSSCGADNSYTLQKPNFCQKCGVSVGEAPSASSQVSTNASLDEEDSQSVPSVNGLDFDIQGELSPRGVTLGTLSQISAEPIDTTKQPKKKAPRVSKKKVLEQFRKEAGAIKPEDA